MARPYKKPPSELRPEAIAIARGIIAEGGLAAFNVRRLAEGLGVSVGTVYNSFADLDELLLEVGASVMDDLAQALRAEPLPGDAEAAMMALARAYIRFTAENPQLWNLLFEHHLPEDRELPEGHRARIAELLDMVEEKMRDATGLTGDAPRDAAATLWAGLHGIAGLGSSGKLATVTGRPTEDVALELVQAALRGLRKGA